MMRKSAKNRISSVAIAMTVALSVVLGLSAPISSLEPLQDYTRDKAANTAYIVEKSAIWEDPDNYLAQLTLAVNGIVITEPLDVVICLDRSGSMDMNYIQALSGTHTASCPCLNQDHFYLKPIDEVDFSGVGEPADKDEIIYNPSGTITVYNFELGVWKELDTAKEEHLYYEFSGKSTVGGTYELAAYHFKMDNNGEYVRISKWDTSDLRRRPNSPTDLDTGMWDHADENEGCFDRWIEAKEAVSEFSKMLLGAHPENNVALIPFSIRDVAMLEDLNSNNSKNNIFYRDWLIENNHIYNYFDSHQVTILAGNKLSGTYNSKVSWTDDPTKIDDMLPRLFTTGNTDYVYALSSAYNMLTERKQHDKDTKRAVVVFLSDGVPYPLTASITATGAPTLVAAFYNTPKYIKELRDAIVTQPGSDWVSCLDGTPLPQAAPATAAGFWSAISGRYQRHDVNPSYLTREAGTIVGVPGLGAELLSVSYMVDGQYKYILEDLSTAPELFIEITPENSTGNRLKDALLRNNIFPGGRDSVLRDVVSKYYYVPVDEALNNGTLKLSSGATDTLPSGVTIEGTIAGGQTIVWNIGSIYLYDDPDRPTINIPLVLRDQYRDVEQTTYYPTNDDANPEPLPGTQDPAPDGPDTGAKLYYKNPYNKLQYDTIGTPKLPVPTGNPPPTPPPPPPPPPPPDSDDSEPDPPVPPNPLPPTNPGAPRSDPNNVTDYTPIGDQPVPLANIPALTTIFEDGVPLGRLPATGGSNSIYYYTALFGAFVLLYSVISFRVNRDNKGGEQG